LKFPFLTEPSGININRERKRPKPTRNKPDKRGWKQEKKARPSKLSVMREYQQHGDQQRRKGHSGPEKNVAPRSSKSFIGEKVSQTHQNDGKRAKK
jgi:hypothetical protein